jgi:hypothetical protein
MEVRPMLRRLIVALLALGGAGYAGYQLVLKPWWRRWGVMPDEAIAPLPGDEVVPDAMTSETRGITIDAPPAAVWPWLVQMGYGRGGWYSYDAVDMTGHSTDRILPEHQGLKAGDLVPTHPGGGFVVKLIDPEKALVLFADTSLMQEQSATEEASLNLRATGAVLERAQPTDFAASWAFVLEPLPDGRTRLLERVRARFGETDQPWQRYTMPLMGFGVFVMVRRQLLGIKRRAEQQPLPVPPEVASEVSA